MKNFIRLLGYLTPYKGKMGTIFIFMLLYTLFNGVSMMTIIPIIDKVLGGKEIKLITSISIPFQQQINALIGWLNSVDRYPDLLNIMVIFIFSAMIIKEISYYFQRVLTEILGQGVIRDLRNTVFSHIHSLSMDYFAHERTGALMSRITSDVGTIAQVFTGRFSGASLEGLQVIVYAAIIVFIQWKLAILALGLFLFLILPILIVGRKIRKVSKKSQDKIADMNSILHETIYGIRIVKAFSMEEYEKRKFERENQRFFSMMIQVARKAAALSPITQLAGMGMAMFIMYYLAREVIKGDLTVGLLMLFVGALLSCLKPVKAMTRVSITWQKAWGALERIFHLLDVKPSVVQAAHPVPIKEVRKGISFRNISFAYKDEDWVLKNVNLDAHVGEIVAVVGPSGSGKTSLLNLLPRFYDPISGGVEIDGVDVRKVSIKDLRNLIGMVTQETILFNDTVKNNIAYGRIDATMDEIIHAAKLANAHDFITAFPQGYDSMIGERGTKISGGQKQRLSIARAILKNPAILILDEATSALDTESERLVQDAIDKLMQHRTVFVVAHRLSTVQHADRIVVLEKGRIVQTGHHLELVEREGLYRKLYELQFSI